MCVHIIFQDDIFNSNNLRCVSSVPVTGPIAFNNNESIRKFDSFSVSVRTKFERILSLIGKQDSTVCEGAREELGFNLYNSCIDVIEKDCTDWKDLFGASKKRPRGANNDNNNDNNNNNNNNNDNNNTVGGQQQQSSQAVERKSSTGGQVLTMVASSLQRMGSSVAQADNEEIVNNISRESDDEADEGEYEEEMMDDVESAVMSSAGEDPGARKRELKKFRKRKGAPVTIDRIFKEPNGTSSVVTAAKSPLVAISTWSLCRNKNAQKFGHLEDLFSLEHTDVQAMEREWGSKKKKFAKLKTVLNKTRIIDLLKQSQNSVKFLGEQIIEGLGISRKSETIFLAQEAHRLAGFGTVGEHYAHIDASDVSLATNDERGEDKTSGGMVLRGNEKFIKAVEVERLKVLVQAEPKAAFKAMLVEGDFEGRRVLREFMASDEPNQKSDWTLFKISNEAFERVEYIGCEGKIASARAHLQHKKSPYMSSSRGFYICVNAETEEVRLVIIIYSFCRFTYFLTWLFPDYVMVLATINVLRTLQGLLPVSYKNNDLYKAVTSDRTGGKKHLLKKRKID